MNVILMKHGERRICYVAGLKQSELVRSSTTLGYPMRGFPCPGVTLLSASGSGINCSHAMRHMDAWTDVSLEWPDIGGLDLANSLKRISSVMETWTISMSVADLSGIRQA